MAAEIGSAAVEQQIKVLQFQNSKLSEQLDAHKAKITSLEDTIAQAEQKEQQRSQTLLCINRLWEQLNSDIANLAERATADVGGEAAAETAGGNADGDEDAAGALQSISDPFLRRLLTDASEDEAMETADAAQAADDDLTDVEKVLQARATSTLKALSNVLRLLQLQSSYRDGLAAKIADATTADAVLRDENARLSRAAEAAAARADAAAAARRAAEAAMKQAEDRLFEAEESMKRIKNDLADREYELQAAQKKAQRAKEEAARLKQQLATSTAAAAAAGAGALSTAPSLATQPSADSAGGGGGGVPAAAGPPPPPPPPPGEEGSGGAAGQQQQGGGQQAGGQQQESAEGLRLELETVRQLLEQRTHDAESEKVAHDRTKRELSDSQARMASDMAWVQQTAIYQAARRESERLLSELDARVKERDAAARERDSALSQLASFNTTVEQERKLRDRIMAQGKQIQLQQTKLADLMQEKQSLEGAMAESRARRGAGDTVAELKTMAATLQKEVEVLQARLQKQQDLEARMAAARQGMEAAAEQAEDQKQRAARLQEALRRHKQESATAGVREAELKENLMDLRAFLEVVTAYSLDTSSGVTGGVTRPPGNGAAADLERLRKAEARARLEVAALRRQLEGHELQAQLAAAKGRAEDLQTQLEAAGDARRQLQQAVARLTAQVSTLQGDVEREKASSNAYIEEIVQASEAYETMQSQNTRLLQSLTEKDDAANALAAEKLRLQQQFEALQDQLAAAQAEAAQLTAEQAESAAVREAMGKDAARMAADLSAARDAARSATSRSDALSRDLAAREEALASLRAQLEAAAAAGERERRRREEGEEALGKERAKRQRAEDDAKALHSKMGRLRRSQDATEAVQELELEVAQVRKRLKCSVCCEREKNVIIKKCWHMFCKQCVDRVIEARSRKCPGCGHKFAEGDVQSVYLT